MRESLFLWNTGVRLVGVSPDPTTATVDADGQSRSAFATGHRAAWKFVSRKRTLLVSDEFFLSTFCDATWSPVHGDPDTPYARIGVPYEWPGTI